ncbi:MAG: tetratricopeptide repeat protein [Paracoccaceae bacterium]|nr:tetratricopeptide repeat protein [Paracoccaceae bacterium]
MLELGNNPAAGADLIKDGSEMTFMDDVIDASRETPVIVDFWAPWCGPCKTLGPALEAAVTEAGGKVKMVKIDVDQNQNIAGQLKIQSIPTVYAFFDGKPVDGFQGNQTPAEIKGFVTRVAALGGTDNGLGDALEAADVMFDEGDIDDALQTYAAVLGEEPENIAAFAGVGKCHLALGQIDELAGLIEAVPAPITNRAEIDGLRAQLALALEAAEVGPLDELRAAVAADDNDLEARFNLALAMHGTGEVQGAVDELLTIFKKDREWNDGAAKTQLFKIFDALTAQDPIALNGRRKLSSMIFM